MDTALYSASEESVKLLNELKSLRAHYEAFCTLQVTSDDEMLRLISLLDETRLNWRNAQIETNCLKATNESLTNENKKVIAELSTTRDKLRESQAQIAALSNTTQSLEREIIEYKKRFNVVKNILREQNARDIAHLPNGHSDDNAMGRLMNLPFLKNEPSDGSSENLSVGNGHKDSHGTIEDIDYDKTEDTFGDVQYSDDDSMNEDNVQQRRSRGIRLGKNRNRNMDRRPVRRRSISQQPSPLITAPTTNYTSIAKRTVQSIAEEEYPYLSSEQSPAKRSKGELGQIVCSTKKIIQNTPRKSSIRRSISEASLLHTKTPTMYDRIYTGSTLQMRSPMIGFGSTWTRGRPIADCTHTFKIEKFNLLGSCVVCLKSFSNTGYKSFRCNECKCTVHEGCKILAPAPCIPAVKTPQRNQKHRPRLADFCPDSRPKIPALLVRSVVALEKNYLNTVGLYRVPGSENEVKKLFDAFNSGFPPNLSTRDPETICGSIKRFLRELREPLIPTSSYDEFIQAVENNSREQLMSAVAELPIPNLDTLAYLCSHWQKVAHNSSINQMPIENLATCLGPTIVGSSSKFGCLQNNARIDQHLETRRQNDVLLHLLKLDQSYWVNILTSPVVTTNLGSSIQRNTNVSMRRPLRELDADKSFLGPVSKTPSRDALIQPLLCKTNGTPARAYFERPY